MHTSIPNHNYRTFFVLLIGFMALLLAGCGGGGSDSGDSGGNLTPPPTETESEDWERFTVVYPEGDIPINPNVIARTDSQGLVHVFYYEEDIPYDSNQVRYQIKHAVWDPATTALVGEINTVDLQPPYPDDPVDSGLSNCYLLDAGFTTNDEPIIAYQGGEIPHAQGQDDLECNHGAQGDLMVNLFEDDAWYEYLGIQGDAEPKNPFFTDGYVGLAGSMAVDSQNNIHMAGQHYFEFCDWTSTNYPDLLYVRQTPGDLGGYSIAWEEHVDDYNTYGGGGGVQSDMGHYAKLVLDRDEQPLIFYVGTPINGDHPSLRMARKSGTDWIPEDIQEDLDWWTSKPLSPAVAPDGTIAVAYFMEDKTASEDQPDHLRYAVRQEDGEWSVTQVDISSNCGNFCSLAFDADSRPAIAYYDVKSSGGRDRKNLKLARYDGTGWYSENISTTGDIGRYNTLWFDADNVAHICTFKYDANIQQIIIFREKRA